MDTLTACTAGGGRFGLFARGNVTEVTPTLC
jgi:hypothetical protein